MRYLFFLSLLSLQALAADPWIQQQKIPLAGANNVAVNGNTSIVGAPLSGAGAANVYTRNGNSWAQQQVLTPTDAPGLTDRYGFSVAIAGDTAVVSAPQKAPAGAVYVFVRSGDTWTQQQKLTPTDVNVTTDFGQAVSISGDTIVVGAPTNGAGGAAYVFVRSGSTWSLQQKVIAAEPLANSNFGIAVAITGDNALIGQVGDASQLGAVYAFARTGTTWAQQQKLSSPDAIANDSFGGAVSMDGDSAIVGSIGINSAAGSAYLYTRVGNAWIYQQTLRPLTLAALEIFGVAVSLRGNTAVVGAAASFTPAQGSAYIFSRNGTVWNLQQKIQPQDGANSNRFGTNVSVSGDTIFVAAPGTTPGSAYVFQSTETPCSYQLARTAISTAAIGDTVSIAVKASASTCSWNPQGQPAWISLRGGYPVQGNGALRLAIAANTTAAARSGSIFINGQGVTILQAANGCAFTPGTQSLTLPATAATSSITMTTAAGCEWTPFASPNWIGVHGGPSGPTALNYDASPNSGSSARTASISAGGQTVQVLQTAAAPVQAFSDVALTHPFFSHIGLMKDNAITSGCTSTTYCPDTTTTRGQMAVFLIRALLGGDTFTFPAAPYFDDVPSNHPFFKYIQKVRELGITSGCSATQYCPDDPITRGQMAVFLVRARLGLAAGDPLVYPQTPFFTDVPATDPFFAFIQKMKELGVTSGCSATAYCPTDPNTRGQMAVFLVRGLLTP